MTLEVMVPHWYAEKLIEHYGSLQAAQEQFGLKIVDGYWHDLAQETQARVNEKPLPRGSGQGQHLAPASYIHQQAEPAEGIGGQAAHTQDDQLA